MVRIQFTDLREFVTVFYVLNIYYKFFKTHSRMDFITASWTTGTQIKY